MKETSQEAVGAEHAAEGGLGKGEKARVEGSGHRSSSVKSSMVRLAFRMRARSVPGFSSQWSGTESVTGKPGLTITMWLPRCRFT